MEKRQLKSNKQVEFIRLGKIGAKGGYYSRWSTNQFARVEVGWRIVYGFSWKCRVQHQLVGEKSCFYRFGCCLLGYNLMLLGTSHSSTVPSTEPDAIFVPSGENATARTQPVCPENEAICFCVATSHISTLSSQDPEASFMLSGENATEKLADPSPSVSVVKYWPVPTSHNLMSSNDAEASFVPSGENATEKTGDPNGFILNINCMVRLRFVDIFPWTRSG